jgi:4-hydroxybenzoate polyprenyltransferase
MAKISENILTICCKAACKEVDITRRLLSSNASFGFGVYLASLIPRMLSHRLDAIADPGSLILKVLFAALANNYVFEICNQALSPEEDALNRPSRPIPAGLMTVKGAYKRWAISWALFPLLLTLIGSPRAAKHLCNYLVWTFLCYAWPKPGHWFWKNLYTPTTVLFALRLLNALVTSHIPPAEVSFALDGAFALWLLLTIHVQDFHDVEGDRALGRRTLPIVLSSLGIQRLRWLTAFVAVGAGILFVVLGVRLCRDDYTVAVGILAGFQLLGGSAMGVRFLLATSAAQSETTYKLFYVPTSLAVIAYLSLVGNKADW